MKDFSLKMLEKLLLSFKESAFDIIRFDHYWKNKKCFDEREKVLLLRHDVDRFPETALDSALMENKIGIAGTYFFRTKPWTLKADIIKEISLLGHEIGYHYENLADSNGNYQNAKEDFIKNLSRLRKISEVNSVAMHSRPLSKWDNRLFWDKYPLEEFGLGGEPYKSIDHFKYVYLADSGRDWNSDRVVVWDNVEGGSLPLIQGGTEGLINLIKQNKFTGSIQLLIHPNRWPKSDAGWLAQTMMDTGINFTKKIILITKNKK